MSNLVDIKDKTPNQGLIERLEGMLEEAKSGEIRGLYYVVSFDDQTVGYSWVTDGRISETVGYERLSGCLHKLLTEFTMWRILQDGDSATVQGLRNRFLELE